MSGVTITAGWSFSGGITITEAPLLENTGAWFGGGRPGPYSRVDRITYATDTVTASVRGPLSATNRYLAASGNTTDGWFGGGQVPAPGSPGVLSRVDRITYATDTATASVRGPLSLARYYLAAAGNTTDGWFIGGQTGVAGDVSTVDRITFATDTDTASVRGPISLARTELAAAGNTTDAWFVGQPGYNSTVNRITFATDTATSTVRGPLSLARITLAATGNSDYGWFTGGAAPPAPYGRSRVDRITYATDTATASVRGPLSSSIYGHAAAGNSTDGWFGGGGPGALSRVARITWATDTVTASNRGPLSLARNYMGAAGGIQ